MANRTLRTNRWWETTWVCVAVCAMISGCATGPGARIALWWHTPEDATVAATETSTADVQAESSATTNGVSKSATTPEIVQVGQEQEATDGSASKGLGGVARKLTAPAGRVFSALVRKTSTTDSDEPNDPFLNATTKTEKTKKTNTKPSKPVISARRGNAPPVTPRASVTTSPTRPDPRTAESAQAARQSKANSAFVPGFDSQMDRLRAEMRSKPQATVRSNSTSIARDDSPLDLDARPRTAFVKAPVVKTPVVKTDVPVDRQRELSFEEKLDSVRTTPVARTSLLTAPLAATKPATTTLLTTPLPATPPARTTVTEVAVKTVSPTPSVATAIVDPFLSGSDQLTTPSVSPSSVLTVEKPVVDRPVVTSNRQENIEFGPRRNTVRETVETPRENVDRAIYENLPVRSFEPKSVAGQVDRPQEIVKQSVSEPRDEFKPFVSPVVSPTVQQVSATARPLPVGLETTKRPQPIVNLAIPVASGEADLAMIVDSSTIPKRLGDATAGQRRRFADLDSPTRNEGAAPRVVPRTTTRPSAVAPSSQRKKEETSQTDNRNSAASLPVEFQFSSPNGQPNKGTVAGLTWEGEPVATTEPSESASSFMTPAAIAWGIGLAFLIVLVLRSRSHRRFDLAR